MFCNKEPSFELVETMKVGITVVLKMANQNELDFLYHEREVKI
jgi:hypothetical protein